MSIKYIQFKDNNNNYLYPVVTVNTIVGSDNQTPVMPVITTDFAVAGTTATASAGIIKPNNAHFSTDANGFLSANSASTSSAGIVELATVQEAIDGSDSDKAVTPAGLAAAISGASTSLDYADIEDIITGGSNGIVTADTLQSALKVGRALDVTSLGTASNADASPTSSEYRGNFELIPLSPGSAMTYGFSAFPKFISGSRYLFIADISRGDYYESTEVNITLPNNSLMDTTQSIPPDGSTIRIAWLFDTAATQFSSNSLNGNHYSFLVSHCRQFDVTALDMDSIRYLAGLNNPDDVDDQYVIDKLEINPWIPIVDLSNMSTASVYPGRAYKIYATSGTHVLTAENLPINQYGLDAYLDIYVSDTALIQVQSPLVLVDALTAEDVNHCVVKFRGDGTAEIVTLVAKGGGGTSDTYKVTLATGTADGSLYYGLTSSDLKYLIIDPTLNGTAISATDVVLSESNEVIGQNPNNTNITIEISNGGNNNLILANMTLNNLVNSGAIITLNGCKLVGTLTTDNNINIEYDTIVDVDVPLSKLKSINGGYLVGTNTRVYSGQFDNLNLKDATIRYNTSVAILGSSALLDNCVLSYNTATVLLSGCTLTKCVTVANTCTYALKDCKLNSCVILGSDTVSSAFGTNCIFSNCSIGSSYNRTYLKCSFYGGSYIFSSMTSCYLQHCDINAVPANLNNNTFSSMSLNESIYNNMQPTNKYYNCSMGACFPPGTYYGYPYISARSSTYTINSNVVISAASISMYRGSFAAGRSGCIYSFANGAKLIFTKQTHINYQWNSSNYLSAGGTTIPAGTYTTISGTIKSPCIIT